MTTRRTPATCAGTAFINTERDRPRGRRARRARPRPAASSASPAGRPRRRPSVGPPAAGARDRRGCARRRIRSPRSASGAHSATCRSDLAGVDADALSRSARAVEPLGEFAAARVATRSAPPPRMPRDRLTRRRRRSSRRSSTKAREAGGEAGVASSSRTAHSRRDRDPALTQMSQGVTLHGSAVARNRRAGSRSRSVRNWICASPPKTRSIWIRRSLPGPVATVSSTSSWSGRALSMPRYLTSSMPPNTSAARHPVNPSQEVQSCLRSQR